MEVGYHFENTEVPEGTIKRIKERADEISAETERRQAQEPSVIQPIIEKAKRQKEKALRSDWKPDLEVES